MRHYVVVFLESSLFPGTWVTDHFVRQAEREEIPEIIAESFVSHGEAISQLKKWQNEKAPDPAWTLEECILGGVAALTVLTFGAKEKPPKRVAEYRLRGILSR